MTKEASNLPEIDEKILEVLRRGALAPVVLKPLKRPDAITLRMRIYRAIKTMQKYQHPDVASAKLCTCLLRQLDQHHWALIIQPRDYAYDGAFAAAGIKPSLDDLPDLE